MNIRFSPLLATGTRVLVPTLVLFSIVLLIVGHDAPGGGFAGGLVASAAVLLIFLAYGVRGVRRALPVEPEMVIGVGLALAIAAGVLGALLQGTFLTATYAATELPLIGDVKLSSLLLFDVGVYVLVVGLVTSAIVRLGTGEP